MHFPGKYFAGKKWGIEFFRVQVRLGPGKTCQGKFDKESVNAFSRESCLVISRCFLAMSGCF